MSLTVTSDAFQPGQPIPEKHTGDGDDVSPPLNWGDSPTGTQEFAVICDDPDAPSAEPWVHWVIYKIPADVTSLPEGIPAALRLGSPITALQGKNSWTDGRSIGYRGPAPPPGHGVHHYHFKVYALSAELELDPGLTKGQLLSAIQSSVIASGELVGRYSR
jgi:Raf kinase inhibitor-like YbhB/YbcL family protein